MSAFAFVITLVFIGVGIPVIGGLYADYHKRKLKLREKELEILGSQTAERAAQYAAQTERLEQRVRVLERIATDKGVDLADEIDRLSDNRMN